MALPPHSLQRLRWRPCGQAPLLGVGPLPTAEVAPARRRFTPATAAASGAAGAAAPLPVPVLPVPVLPVVALGAAAGAPTCCCAVAAQATSPLITGNDASTATGLVADNDSVQTGGVGYAAAIAAPLMHAAAVWASHSGGDAAASASAATAASASFATHCRNRASAAGAACRACGGGATVMAITTSAAIVVRWAACWATPVRWYW